ncbi:MAG: methylenetetrahydrofolate--tRNA-(uracil(54)-C(5))-methyltransferase (FADH(2)-oxidizing) TrmFO [Proteobacteria bacterium]|nr:methylenetetrahydrofolate--tRNA-(uracil(54)-C(5))-methyltransferase (FADH(2)-oxidizing) TrmFO [Pseudomonadota bacterium]
MSIEFLIGRQAAAAAQGEVVVVGGGLAGCEAAYQAALRGARVTLLEMKPSRYSPAHSDPGLAELVCSNSLRGASLGNAVGLLKEEMRRLGSLVMEAADATAVPAGRALAVERTAFSKHMTERIADHPRIQIREQVVESIPEAPVVVLATGPLTAPELARSLERLLGEESLYFYDAISPIVYADSVDSERVFRASRYEDGEGDYLNVPLDRDEYERFVDDLLAAETVPLHKFEASLYFEGCLPIEEMARRGRQTLAFGPLKPVGLVDPRTGRRPHAVLQLRQEDKSGVLFGLVGCQTKLRIREQQRIFRSLPGLGEAVFARYGSVHRNTFVNAPRRLAPTLELRARPGCFIAGQMAGVEGYVESAALGWLAGVQAARAVSGRGPCLPPPETAHAALLRHLREAEATRFQPMNVNYGLFPALPGPRRKQPKREKNQQLAERALAALAPYGEEAVSSCA